MVCRIHLALFAVAVATVSTGCVERRFRVETQPPGAYVYVNNLPVGVTPVDVPFVYYGDYDIKIVKEGYQTLKVKQNISTPWYQYPIVDFFSENLWPMQITDSRPFLYALEPVMQPNLELLKTQAEELRSRAGELPAPRYPDPRKNTPVGEPIRKKDTPDRSNPPMESLPPPKELKLPAPKDGESIEPKAK